MDKNEITKGGGDYIGYDYKTVITDSDNASMYIDCYRNFGWQPDESAGASHFGLSVTLKFKRDRKITNKAELTRLQNHFEACMDEIKKLESSKTQAATAISIAVGLIGTAFIAGSTFAVTHEPPMILLCILLAIPGFIGWGLPYFLFKYFNVKRAEEVKPLIELKYDEIHEICEKGSRLQ